MSSIVLKIKDTLNKASKKGLEYEAIYLSKQDYSEFCSDLKMDNAAEMDINGLKISIIKIEDKEKSYFKTKENLKKKKKNEETITKYYI